MILAAVNSRASPSPRPTANDSPCYGGSGWTGRPRTARPTAQRREGIEGEGGGGVADRLLRQPDVEGSRTDREPQRWVEHGGLSVESRIDGGSRRHLESQPPP